METTTRPGRIVDAEFYGWWGVGGGTYTSYRDRTAHVSYEDIAERHGPVRPVVPAAEEDVAELRLALIRAGRKAVTTLLAALGKVWEARMTAPTGSGEHDWDLPMRALVAGRPGSWESAALQDATGFGRDLLHGSPKRVDPASLEAIGEVLWRWTDGPEYVELAETLGGALSRVADEHGAAGWVAVADQWLQPESLARDDFVLCYRWLYATSTHFDVSVL